MKAEYGKWKTKGQENEVKGIPQEVEQKEYDGKREEIRTLEGKCRKSNIYITGVQKRRIREKSMK